MGPGAAVSSEASLNANLLRAAARGDTERVALLLQQGADVNCSNEVLQSPLIKAAEYGRPRTALQLLRRGANVDAADRRGSTALHYAAHLGHAGTVQVLVTDGGAEVGRRNRFGFAPLHYAAAAGRDEAVACLLDLGADPNAMDSGNWTALHRAAGGGHASTILLLVRRGAYLEGVPPPDLAAAANSTSLAASAPSVTDTPAPAPAPAAPPPPGGYSPLHEAVWCGGAAAVQALMDLGADAVRPDGWGKTPLELAQSLAREGCADPLTIIRRASRRRGRCARAAADDAAGGRNETSPAPLDGSVSGSSDSDGSDCRWSNEAPRTLSLDLLSLPF